jgi:hypothetical protein
LALWVIDAILRASLLRIRADSPTANRASEFSDPSGPQSVFDYLSREMTIADRELAMHGNTMDTLHRAEAHRRLAEVRHDLSRLAEASDVPSLVGHNSSHLGGREQSGDALWHKVLPEE